MSKRKFEPGVYRHFKENKPLNERMYYGIGRTLSVNFSKFGNVDPRCFVPIKTWVAHHTETGELVEVILYGDGTFRTKLDENFIFYKALYGDEEYYVRPADMFLSPRDAEKYPQFSQYWRMEIIS